MTTSTIDEITFRGGAHTQQNFRQRILNLTGSEPSSTCICHKFCSLIVQKFKNEDITKYQSLIKLLKLLQFKKIRHNNINICG